MKSIIFGKIIYLIIFIVFLSIITGYFLTTQKSKKDLQIIQVAACPDLDNIKSQIQTDWKDKVKIHNYNQAFKEDVAFKRKASEPYLHYKSEKSISLYFYPISIEEIAAYYTKNIEKNILTLGFSKNILNTWNGTQKIVFEDNKTYKAYKFGYTNKDKIIIVSIENDVSIGDYPDSSITFDIGCATQDSKLDAIYSDLLSAPEVQRTLEGIGEVAKTHFIIWNIYKNGTIIETDTFPAEFGAGSVAWFYNDGKNWKGIYGGQEEPSCSLLEGLRIENGVECLDNKTLNYRKTGESINLKK